MKLEAGRHAAGGALCGSARKGLGTPWYFWAESSPLGGRPEYQKDPQALSCLFKRFQNIQEIEHLLCAASGALNPEAQPVPEPDLGL